MRRSVCEAFEFGIDIYRYVAYICIFSIIF